MTHTMMHSLETRSSVGDYPRSLIQPESYPASPRLINEDGSVNHDGVVTYLARLVMGEPWVLKKAIGLIEEQQLLSIPETFDEIQQRLEDRGTFGLSLVDCDRISTRLPQVRAWYKAGMPVK